eukprot:7997613-Karenia_brevis.AAC.1
MASTKYAELELNTFGAAVVEAANGEDKMESMSVESNHYGPKRSGDHMTPMRHRDPRESKQTRLAIANEMTDIEHMMSRMLAASEARTQAFIQHHIGTRLTNIESTLSSNEHAINQERVERQQEISTLRADIERMEQKMESASKAITPKATPRKNEREPVCVLGGFERAPRETVQEMIAKMMEDVEGFVKIQPMGSIPKVAFLNFDNVDNMFNFCTNFKEKQDASSKLWIAPKRRDGEEEDNSQI